MQNKQIDIILRQNHKNFHKQRLFTHEYAYPQPKSDSVLNVKKNIQSERVRKRRHLDGDHINNIYSSKFLKINLQK